ncbi:transposase [Paracoccus homiensis]|uniref:IstB-like ATP binding N-terminal n=1 Tax=Paracoccus homiensis TaxID=364199 RepID=A0A1I0JEL2_9RHOB|nr:transposase [Paracoccus homiensis]SEU08546.1 IstB-like ATP binding N-terminal [Paracoccus homiensis]
MSIETTLRKLDDLKLKGMREALRQQAETPRQADMAFEDRLAMLVDAEELYRQNARKDRLLRAAKLRVADGFISAHAILCKVADDLDKAVKKRAKAHPVARRLMTIPGVGPVNALSFIALVDDPGQLSRTSDVGAFLGLTPKRYQSGEVDWSGRVSKCGDGAMRGLLFEAASCIIGQVTRFSPLKSWAVRLAGRRGFRKAAVATARKIAVLMLTLWKNGTDYQWTKEATA